MSINENSAWQVVNDTTVYHYNLNREEVNVFCWLFEHNIHLVEKCHILEH